MRDLGSPKPRTISVDDRRTWPPPPHDPREREIALEVSGWEVRVFGARKFQYFVTRGYWHLQLWHPRARISVLTPSRLTRGFYEAYPIANWKGQALHYDQLVSLLAGIHDTPLPSKADVMRLERALVDDVVRAKTSWVS
jgi:hypothetical protein